MAGYIGQGRMEENHKGWFGVPDLLKSGHWHPKPEGVRDGSSHGAGGRKSREEEDPG